MDIGLDVAAPVSNEDTLDQLQARVIYIIKYLFITEEKFNVLNTFLKSSGSLLRSRSFIKNVASTTRDYNDFVFYVPLSAVREAYNIIQYFFNCNNLIIYTTKEYCRQRESLWGVRKKYVFRGINNSTITIMAVRNSHTPLQVLKNLDFSFLEVWYDGEKVNATDPTGILEKKGFLKTNEPVRILKKLKMYRGLIGTFIENGYTVSIDKEFLKKNNTIPIDTVVTQCNPPVIDDEYYNRYTSKLLLRSIARDGVTVSGFIGKDREAVIINFARIITRLDQVDRKKVIEEDDGYDSEELNTAEDFLVFMQFKSTSTGTETILDVYHRLNEFADSWSKKYRFREIFSYIYDVGRFSTKRPDDYKPFEKYIYKIWRRVVQKGEHDGKCVKTGEDGKVFSMHFHKESNSISSKGLMQYLDEIKEEWKKPKDETDSYVPCFVPDCVHFITPEDILFIVDDEWYVEYFRPLYEGKFIYYAYKYYKQQENLNRAINDRTGAEEELNNDLTDAGVNNDGDNDDISVISSVNND
jgi:hypothetical protein